ncbi:MAG: hypothetical protein AAF607_01240 [Pseudomonadota bacterium]
MVLDRKSALWQDFLDHFDQDFGEGARSFELELAYTWTWYSKEQLAQLRARIEHCVNADCHDDDLWPEWMDGPAQIHPGPGEMRAWFKMYLDSLDAFIARDYKPE